MVSSMESPRVSFSSEFSDESNFITICPSRESERETAYHFEFLSINTKTTMIAADELISDGNLLPFHHTDAITFKSNGHQQFSEQNDPMKEKESRITWFVDEDPSPRPPTCTVLWKELLKLKNKQRSSTLSSSASSSSSSRFSVADILSGDERREGVRSREECSKRKKKGEERERKRSSSVRIRPVLNVPICTQAKNAAAGALPPLFSFRKGRCT